MGLYPPRLFVVLCCTRCPLTGAQGSPPPPPSLTPGVLPALGMPCPTAAVYLYHMLVACSSRRLTQCSGRKGTRLGCVCTALPVLVLPSVPAAARGGAMGLLGACYSRGGCMCATPGQMHVPSAFGQPADGGLRQNSYLAQHGTVVGSSHGCSQADLLRFYFSLSMNPACVSLWRSC